MEQKVGDMRNEDSDWRTEVWETPVQCLFF